MYLLNLDRGVARIISIQSFGADLQGVNLRCVLTVELSEALAFIILHNLLSKMNTLHCLSLCVYRNLNPLWLQEFKNMS